MRELEVSLSRLNAWNGFSPQPVDATPYLKGKDGVYCDESKIRSRFPRGRENGVVGSVAALFALGLGYFLKPYPHLSLVTIGC